MVRVVGLLACVLIAILPVGVQSDVHLLMAGSVAALFCAEGLLLPSLGLAITGSTAALLVFSAALLMAPATETAGMAAVRFGIALLGLLDATYYRRCFRNAVVDRSVTHEHLSTLAVSMAVAVGVAALLAAIAAVFPMQLTALNRPVAAGAAVVLTSAAVVRTARGARVAQRPRGGDGGRDARRADDARAE